MKVTFKKDGENLYFTKSNIFDIKDSLYEDDNTRTEDVAGNIILVSLGNEEEPDLYIYDTKCKSYDEFIEKLKEDFRDNEESIREGDLSFNLNKSCDEYYFDLGIFNEEDMGVTITEDNFPTVFNSYVNSNLEETLILMDVEKEEVIELNFNIHSPIVISVKSMPVRA